MEAIGDIQEPGMPRQETAVEMRELSIAMQSLSERESEIVWLRDGMGLSHREVADRVGISEQASRQAYVRAKRALVSVLDRTPLKGGLHVANELS
jgi:RNA polymerase sigma factor (sigma-70 family)